MSNDSIKNKSLWIVMSAVSVIAIGSAVIAFAGVAPTVMENVVIETYNANMPDSGAVGQMLGGGTRFPNGISADSTSPSAGEVRGATLTSTGAATIGGALAVTGNATIGGTLNANLTSTTTSSGDFTLTAAESLKTVFLQTTGATSTLPAVTNTGATFRFSIKAAFDTNDYTIASAEGDNISGSLFVNDAIVACSGEDKVSFVADGEEIGDFVELISDGTSWNIINSRGETAAKVICTDDA